MYCEFTKRPDGYQMPIRMWAIPVLGLTLLFPRSPAVGQQSQQSVQAGNRQQKTGVDESRRFSAKEAVTVLRNACPWAGVQGEGHPGRYMIAVKVNPENPAYRHVGRYEIRTLVDSGAWSHFRHFNDPAKAIDVLVREGHITEFHPFAEVLDCFPN